MSNLEPLWDPWAETAPLKRWQFGEREFSLGQRVRLAPGGRADIFDMTLAGMTAVIDAIEQDFDDQIHIAVVVDDDPGRDLGEMRQGMGHRFFFKPSELEPLDE